MVGTENKIKCFVVLETFNTINQCYCDTSYNIENSIDGIIYSLSGQSSNYFEIYHTIQTLIFLLWVTPLVLNFLQKILHSYNYLSLEN